MGNDEDREGISTYRSVYRSVYRVPLDAEWVVIGGGVAGLNRISCVKEVGACAVAVCFGQGEGVKVRTQILQRWW